MTPQICDGLYELEERSGASEKKVIGTMRKAVNTLANNEVDSASFLYAEEGVLSQSLFDVLYPETTPGLTPEIIKRMKEKWIGGQYKLVIFKVQDVTDEVELYAILQNTKGKMSDDSPEKAWGLRGYLLRAHLGHIALSSPDLLDDENYWLRTGNFIHVPDNIMATKELLDYLTSVTRNDQYRVIHEKHRLTND